MIHNLERIIAQMDDENIDAIKTVAQKISKRRSGIRRAAMDTLLASGFEIVEADGPLTQDGREVIFANGARLALRPEAHRERLEKAFVTTGNRKPGKPPRPGEGLSSVLCPACQAIMAKSPVCPNCSKGKAGFKILCICTECNHEVYL